MEFLWEWHLLSVTESVSGSLMVLLLLLWSVCLLELKLEFEWEFRLVWLLGCWLEFELV